MDLDYSTIITGLCSGAGGITVAGAIMREWAGAVRKELGDLRGEVKTLREEKLATLEKKVEHLANNCEAHKTSQAIARIEEKQNATSTVLAGISSKIDGFTAGMATLVARMDNHKEWISSVSDKATEHANDHVMHQRGHSK